MSKRKDVRSLYQQGYYFSKSHEEFRADVLEWIGSFHGVEKHFDELYSNGQRGNTLLDSMCDFGMNSLLF